MRNDKDKSEAPQRTSRFGRFPSSRRRSHLAAPTTPSGASSSQTSVDTTATPSPAADVPPPYDGRRSSITGKQKEKSEDDYERAPNWNSEVDSHGQVRINLDLSSLPQVEDHLELPDLLSPQEQLADPFNAAQCPRLNIVIFVVGSRGDVQPYIALALELIKNRGHRVRIATHGDFKELVEGANVRLAGLEDAQRRPLTGLLEHFDIGGDPHQLMAYMVQNPGLLPGVKSITNGDVSIKRKMVGTMVVGCYKATFMPHEGTGRPFAADAIISNPPAFAHIHVAEALGIPLLMSFTMPWSATQRFCHPLVMAKSSSTQAGINNYASFVLADSLMWSGLGRVINNFRTGILGLHPIPASGGPLVLQRLRVPFTYAWSTSLLPKPGDWRSNIDVVGFFSMPNDTFYKPDPALAKFLAAGPPPIYIGFGSVVVKDPLKLTETILGAVQKAGVRALVSAGWADLGKTDIDIPDSVFIIKGNIPHDWLFDAGRVAAVCHHGGAGTTAAGLTAGLPTIIVPFFGDQWFWGNAVHTSGAGPQPIPHAEMTVDILTDAIKFALLPETREAAQVVGESIRSENGVAKGVDSFHKNLPLLNMRCDIEQDRVATWWSETFCLRLSGAAAAVLVEGRMQSWRDLTPHRPVEYEATRHYAGPMTSIAQSILNIGDQAVTGTAQLFYAPGRGISTLAVGIPKASVDVIGGFQEGLENLPGVMGSKVRKRGKVNDFESGVTEAGKGLAYGLYDGITGLVREPIRGAKEGGVGGFIGGIGVGGVGLVARAASGALGLAVYPTAGAFKSVRNKLSSNGLLDNMSVLCDPREAQAHADAESFDKAARRVMTARWTELIAPERVKERRKAEEKRRRKAEELILTQARSATPSTKSGRSTKVGSWLGDHLQPSSSRGSRASSPGPGARPASPSPQAGSSSSSSYRPDKKLSELTRVSADSPPPVPTKDARWAVNRVAESSAPPPAYEPESATASPAASAVSQLKIDYLTLEHRTSAASDTSLALAGTERLARHSLESSRTSSFASGVSMPESVPEDSAPALLVPETEAAEPKTPTTAAAPRTPAPPAIVIDTTTPATDAADEATTPTARTGPQVIRSLSKGKGKSNE